MKLISRLISKEAAGIVDGQAVQLKGKLDGRLLSEIASTCRMHDIELGEIWLRSNGSVSFSSEIPQSKHQQLRNTIKNIGRW